MTADERTQMLAGATQSTDWRRRGAIVAAVAVTLATVAVVSLNASLNFSNAPTKASAAAPREGSSAFTPTVAFPANDFGHRELLAYCEERWIAQPLDQFVTSGDGTYQQRYFVCGQQFFNKENGTIFFYTGNEGDVLLYLNNTGLMWENAEEFNALLVFAEHRYFGESIPFGNDVHQHMQFLSSTQALADYAVLIEALKRELDADVPVIGFGGSYGGMLSAWFRLKYPHVVDGVIAASAPVLHTTTDPENPLNAEAFQNTVVFDMTPAAGSSANCTANTKKAIEALARLGETPDGRATVAQELRLCDPQILQSREQAQILIDTVSGVFGNLAMGNFPYPSSYIMEGLVNLPAYPMRVACENLAGDFGNDDRAALAGLRDALGVYFNATQTTHCLFPPDPKGAVEDVDKGNFWGYLACAELYMPLSNNGENGVFPPQPSSVSQDDNNCMKTWGVHVRPRWAVTQYGGLKALRQASNIVFSNGNYDPFSGTGVLTSLSDSVVAVLVDGGAHHVDLFFTHPMDPPSLTQARQTEKRHIRTWIREFYKHKAQK